jgi:cell division protein FtsW
MNDWKNKIQFSIKGDTALVLAAGLLALFSFAAAFSTSSNLVNLYHSHTHWFYLLKHTVLIFIALVLFLGMQNISIQKIRKFSFIFLIISIGLLVYTLFFGISANGESARRWIKIPFATIQPSFIAMYALMIYTAVYLDKIKNKPKSFSEDLKNYWIYALGTIGLIMPSNNSTALMIFGMILLLNMIGGYPFKRLATVTSVLIMLLGMYYLAAKAFPEYIPNRFETLENRIKRHLSGADEKNKEITQSMRAKIAIASGGIIRWAPGKSVQKNLLSQSSSDFVYAIIVEEYGIAGGLTILVFYFLLFFRIMIIAYHSKEFFLKILTLGLGLPIISQALINMAVATGLFPVTGQPLPLISTGGTTIMMTGLVLGIIVKISEAIYDNE